MSTFDTQRATAIITRGMEGGFFPEGKMPESDGDKIVEAEKLVELARQCEAVKNEVGVHNVPHWPAVEKILLEANVLVGANENGHAVEESQSSGDRSQVQEQEVVVPSEIDYGGFGTTIAPPQKKDDPDSSDSADVHVDRPAQEAPAGAPAVEPETSRDDPKKGEVWADAQGAEWELLKDSLGPQVDVMSLSTGEKTFVPAGMLKRRVRSVLETEQERIDDVIDDFSGEYEFLSNFSSSPITIDGIDYSTVEHAFQAHKSNDPDDRRAVAMQSTPGWAKKAGRALDLRPDWESVKHDVMRLCLAAKFAEGTELAQRLLETGTATLVEGNTWGDDYWGVPRGGTGQNWLGRLLEERREELRKVPVDTREEPEHKGTFTITASGKTSEPIAYDATPEQVDKKLQPIGLSVVEAQHSSSIPEHDDEGDEAYQRILEDTEARYSPSGMPIPVDLVDPPSVNPENFDEVSDRDARALHSKYGALAARAKYLHDVEDARARGCNLLRKLYLRAAMRKARDEELGKSSTLTERQDWAEENDEDLQKWTERAQKHADEASAWKTFFDIYSQHVVNLSRDWTMRDLQQKS